MGPDGHPDISQQITQLLKCWEGQTLETADIEDAVTAIGGSRSETKARIVNALRDKGVDVDNIRQTTTLGE